MIITLILLLGIGGTGFYFGWIQIRIPEDTYGVIFTKLSGWDSRVVRPGEFRWEWQNLVPTNMTLHKFSLEPRQSELKLSGSLPSAESYAYYLEGSPDFSFNYSFLVSYSLKPESLPGLVSDSFLRQDNVDEWYSDFEERLVVDAAEYLKTRTLDEAYMKSIEYDYRRMEKDLIEKLAELYDFVNIYKITPKTIKFPDLRLYEEGRRLFMEMTAFSEEVQKAARERAASRIVEETSKLELLEKYGEIFARYPSLIDYYAIFTEEGKSLIPGMELPELAP